MPPQVFSQANTPLKRWLLDFAFRRKESELKSGVVRKDSMWDKLIFKKVQVDSLTVTPESSVFVTALMANATVYGGFLTLQASLGGRVRLMITGAAPVSPTILTFLRAALGCQVSCSHSLHRYAPSFFCF